MNRLVSLEKVALLPMSDSKLFAPDAFRYVSPQHVLTLELILESKPPFHFVGIGGAGMSALALCLLHQGFQVSGSDLNASAVTAYLEEQGAIVCIGHDTQHVLEEAVLVVSSAIDAQNPEVLVAMERKQSIWHRSQVLQALMHSPSIGAKTTIGLTGTHGKTTLTGMADSVFHTASLNPTTIAGGKLPDVGQNVRLSSYHDICIAELDESDGSILRYAPTYTILANLELDHADHYTHGLPQLIATFRQFMSQLTSLPKQAAQWQSVILNGQCPHNRDLVSAIPPDVRRYWLFDNREEAERFQEQGERYYIQSLDEGHTVRLSHWMPSFTWLTLGDFDLQVPGWHNAWNAGMVAIVAHAFGMEWQFISEGLHAFTGMGRRFEQVGAFNDAILIDDYAHHPTEIVATLEAARSYMAGHSLKGRLISCFQAHRYTRLHAFWSEFAQAFLDTDVLYVLEPYSAHESPIAGVTGQAFTDEVRRRFPHKQVEFVPELDALKTVLQEALAEGDLVLSLGAGTVTQLLRGWKG
jgi:UDP-N-acetylmuramate--alanine ligase